MDAADTAIVTISLSNGAGNTATISGDNGGERTYFAGFLAV